MVSEVHDRSSLQTHFMVSEVCDRSSLQTSFHGVRSIGQSGTLFQKELIQGFQSGFHCVILDLKDLPS